MAGRMSREIDLRAVLVVGEFGCGCDTAIDRLSYPLLHITWSRITGMDRGGCKLGGIEKLRRMQDEPLGL